MKCENPEIKKAMLLFLSEEEKIQLKLQHKKERVKHVLRSHQSSFVN